MPAQPVKIDNVLSAVLTLLSGDARTQTLDGEAITWTGKRTFRGIESYPAGLVWWGGFHDVAFAIGGAQHSARKSAVWAMIELRCDSEAGVDDAEAHCRLGFDQINQVLTDSLYLPTGLGGTFNIVLYTVEPVHLYIDETVSPPFAGVIAPVKLDLTPRF